MSATRLIAKALAALADAEAWLNEAYKEPEEYGDPQKREIMRAHERTAEAKRATLDLLQDSDR